MSKQSTWNFNTNRNELYLLAGLLQSGNLIGFEDPFTGLLSEELEQILKETGTSLINRELISLQENNQVVIDSGITGLIRGLTTSENLIVLMQTKGSPNAYIYHLTPIILIEQTELADGTIAITALKDINTLQRRLINRLSLPSTTTEHAPYTFSLSYADLSKAIELTKTDDGSCKQFLSTLGIPNKEIETLNSIVGKGVQMCTFTILRRGQHKIEHGETIHWLEKNGDIWLVSPLERSQSSSVQVKSITTQWIEQQILQTSEHLFDVYRQ